jgi:hypothetical protein
MRVNRRRNQHFARLLEASSPVAAAADPAMGSLVIVANALRAAGHTTGPAAPDAAFRVALRQRLVAVATVQAAEPAVAGTRAHAGARSAARYRLHPRIAALAGTVAIATSLAGVGVAAAKSLPGDPFYGIKRTTEAVQLWTARGNLATGKRHLEFARTRLAEAQALPPSSSHLASTLAAMNSETTDGSHDLIAAYRSSKSLAPLVDLVIFSRQQVAGLVSLASTLPAAVREQDVKSILLLTGVVKAAHSVSNGACLLCGTPGGPSSPSGHHNAAPPSPSTQPSTSHHGGPSPHSTPTGGIVSSGRPIPTPTHSVVLPSLPPLPTIPPLHHPKHPPPLGSPLPVVSTLLHLGL